MELKDCFSAIDRRSYNSRFNRKEDSRDILLIMGALFVLRYFIKKYTRNLKIEGSLYRFIVYSFISLYGISYLSKEDWVFQVYGISLEWENNYLPSTVRFHYLFEIAHYLISSITILIEPKMKDFKQMLIHHFITLFLIFHSYSHNFHKNRCSNNDTARYFRSFFRSWEISTLF